MEFTSVPVSDLKDSLMFSLNWRNNWELIEEIKPKNCVNDKSKADGFYVHIYRMSPGSCIFYNNTIFLNRFALKSLLER